MMTEWGTITNFLMASFVNGPLFYFSKQLELVLNIFQLHYPHHSFSIYIKFMMCAMSEFQVHHTTVNQGNEPSGC